MKLLNLKEEIKEILEELENMYEISKLEEQVNNINKIRDYIINLQQENKQLKEQLLATQTNEETFRLEMEDITRILGLDEDTIFDDVKTYARSLKENKILRENAEHNDKVVDKVNWENMLLKKENQELSEENIQLKSDNESLVQKQSQNDLLLSANGYFTLGNNSMALETLDKVNYNDLSSDQKIIYDNIKNNIN